MTWITGQNLAIGALSFPETSGLLESKTTL